MKICVICGLKRFFSGTTILGSWWRESRLAWSRQASGRQVQQGHVFGEVYMCSPCRRTLWACACAFEEALYT
ncbi:MAG: hypothetical protein [Olavius algarvensis Gamma 1 endosymbiont]|nr:MAG: hypothetical protein [Olavius algarvensis Gamma 1 endosymbiont]